jgi:hypothetical protein
MEVLLGLGFDGCATKPPPSRFWRVSSWNEPFEPPPPAAPLGSAPEDDDGHRYDDPHGRESTLYCATEPQGALGECLAEFAYNAAAAVRIETFLDGDADPEHDRDYQRPLDEADILAFEWKLASASADTESVFIDVDNWRSYLAVAPKAIPAVARLGITRWDRSVLLSARRSVTRTLAGIWKAEAVDPFTHELRASGLRFTSRLPPAWECWALWEPLAVVEEDREVVDVTIDLPELKLAAAMLGVALVD